jgi:hypothetical protein
LGYRVASIRRPIGRSQEETMEGSGKWVLGGLVAMLALVALFAASRAHDSDIYLFGLIFFAAAIIFVFGLIGSNAGRRSDPR